MAENCYEHWADRAATYLKRGFTFEHAARLVLCYDRRSRGAAQRTFQVHLQGIVKVLKERNRKVALERTKESIIR